MGVDQPYRACPDACRSPLVIAVPHGGQDYPPDIENRVRVPLEALRLLEDRHAGLLADVTEADGHYVLRMPVPRLIIDLNRHEDEIDPALIGYGREAMRFRSSIKVRGGLGLIPSRLGGVGVIWKQPLAAAEVAMRLEHYHQPWHAAIASALQRRVGRFGKAVLIDLHSMPPISDWRQTGPVPRIVTGDGLGRSAAPWVMACAEDELRASGLALTRNHPYAGGYALERHGAPARQIHAFQIEVDRALYLDAALDAPGAGLATMQSLLARLAHRMTREAEGPALLAAE